MTERPEDVLREAVERIGLFNPYAEAMTALDTLIRERDEARKQGNSEMFDAMVKANDLLRAERDALREEKNRLIEENVAIRKENERLRKDAMDRADLLRAVEARLTQAEEALREAELLAGGPAARRIRAYFENVEAGAQSGGTE